MNIDDLTVGQAKEIAKLFSECMCTAEVDTRGLVRIIVLQRGWVAVGRFYQCGEACRLDNAFVIRRWGTSKGLGEIAEKGPLTNTVLDAAGTLRFHALTIVCQFDCNQQGWAEKCT